MREGVEDCDNIMSLTISGAPETTGVTSFVQEACEAVTVLGTHYRPSQIVLEQSVFQDLKEYFRRPRMVGNGVLPTATRSRVFSTSVTASVLFSSYFLNGFARLSGVFGTRFKLVYTLQVAATPFHQGILALSWQYQTVAGTFDRGSTSQTCTNLPHVRLDLSVDTMVQLTIPFLNVREFLALNESQVYGVINLNNFAEIPSVAGLSAPTYKLFVHLEDLELIGASPQATVTTALQSGKVVAPTEQEFETEVYPVSSGLSSLARTLRWVAKGVPSLSSIAGTASWLVAKTAGAVRAFGYSRPLVQDPIVRMQQLTTVGEMNVDVPAAGIMVGPMASNHLSVTPAFGATDVDEMSLSYIFSRYCQICYGAITTSNTPSQVVYAANVSPTSYWFRAGTSAPYCNVAPPGAPAGNANAFQPSDLFFWSSMFKYWRGGFKFRFTFCKSKFHGGRVMASFIPQYVGAGNTIGSVLNALTPEALGGNTQPFGYTAIFDLRDGNVFTFDVPYMSSMPWASIFDTIGSVSLSIIDPLQAPGVVSSSVNFVVEVAGASDYEVAGPNGPMYASLPAADNIQLQSGKMLPAFSDDVSQFTIGEAITSVKQLIQIPATLPIRSLPAGTTVQQNVFPWYYHAPQSFGAPNVTPAASLTFTYGGNAACCYVYVKGSTDLHIMYTNTGGAYGAIWSSFAAREYGVQPALLAGPYNRPGSSLPRVFTTDGNPAHLRFPAYQTCQRVLSYVLNGVTSTLGLTGATTDIATFPTTIDGPRWCPKFWMANYGSSQGLAVFLSRAAGDDAALSQYIGPPPLMLTAGTGSYYDPDSVQNQ